MTVGGVEIDPKISLGHLLTILSVAVGVIWGYANLNSRVEANEKETLEVKAASLERDVKQDASIADLTKSYNQMALVLEGIRIDVGYLRRSTEEAKRLSGN